MATGELEIERTYLLAREPDASWLAAAGARPIRIEQVYLRRDPDAPVRRLRTIVSADGEERFVYTEKRRLATLLVREEHEREVDRGTRDALLAEVDPDYRPIRKVRHVFDHGGWTFELDVFETPPGLVLLEVELTDPSARPELPPGLDIIREVTEEEQYLNVNLARR